MVIVDTSVWIEYFRDPDSVHGDAVERLINSGEVAIVGVVHAELLQGARTEQEARDLEYDLAAFAFLETKQDTWRRAGRLLFELRRRGVTLPVTDAIIAAAALQAKHEVYTLDEHFQRVPGLRLYKPAGSVNDKG